MIRLFAALVITLAVGILSRQCPIGWYPYDKSLGDVLYAVATYLGIALVLRRQPPLVVAVLALLLCAAVETFKLTGIPAEYGPYSIFIRWTLGTTFAWHNLACYVLGVGIIAGTDRAWLRPSTLAPLGGEGRVIANRGRVLSGRTSGTPAGRAGPAEVR